MKPDDYVQESLEEARRKEASDQKLVLEVTMENKRLTEPLQKANKEVERLRQQLANYNKVYAASYRREKSNQSRDIYPHRGF